MKNVPMAARRSFQFRAEFYNLFNNVNYGNPGTSFGVPLAPPSDGSPPPASMRQVQLGGKGALLIGDVMSESLARRR